jgi:hypothetical protein
MKRRLILFGTLDGSLLLFESEDKNSSHSNTGKGNLTLFTYINLLDI